MNFYQKTNLASFSKFGKFKILNKIILLLKLGGRIEGESKFFLLLGVNYND